MIDDEMENQRRIELRSRILDEVRETLGGDCYWDELPEKARALIASLDAKDAEIADLVTEGIRQKRRANEARAERDALRERLEAVRDVVGWWQTEYVPTDSGWVEICIEDIRKALAPTAPNPTDVTHGGAIPQGSTPNAADPAKSQPERHLRDGRGDE